MAATRSSLLFAGVHALLAATGAIAAGYPTHPIRMVVPFTPGGGTDIIARALGQHLTGAWGQNVIIDNRPGGNTVIASEIVARARPDGHTLIMQINSLTSLPAMAKDGQGTISLDQFSPVSLVASLPHVLVVHRSVPAASVKELVALAKASPGKLNYAIPGIGTPVHLAGALFAAMAGIDVVPVPYKGAAEYTAAHPRQSRADGVRFRAHGDPAYTHRRNQAPRGEHRQAYPAVARCPQRRRELSRLRHRELVRGAGAGQDAEGHRDQAGAGNRRRDEDPEVRRGGSRL